MNYKRYKNAHKSDVFNSYVHFCIFCDRVLSTYKNEYHTQNYSVPAITEITILTNLLDLIQMLGMPASKPFYKEK